MLLLLLVFNEVIYKPNDFMREIIPIVFRGYLRMEKHEGKLTENVKSVAILH